MRRDGGDGETESSAGAHADEARNVHGDDEGGHDQHGSAHAGEHQHGWRVDAHGGERGDFLVDLHGAELGGEGGAGAASEDDGDQQRAKLTEQSDGDEVGDVKIRAELTHGDGGLEGEDHADEEAEHEHQGKRLSAGAVSDAENPRRAGSGVSPAGR